MSRREEQSSVQSRQSSPVVGWKIAAPSLTTASIRYRAFVPILALKQCGFVSRVFSKPNQANLDGLYCLVFVKTFTSDDCLLALEARRRGIPVILDLCDNIFIPEYGKKNPKLAPATGFKRMAAIASVIVASTDPLAAVIHAEIQVQVPILIIPDGIETKEFLVKMREIVESIQRRERDRLLSYVGRMNPLLNKLSILRTADVRKVAVPLFRQYAKRISRRLKQSLLHAPVPGAKRQQSKIVTSYDKDPSIPVPALRSIVWFGHHGAQHARFGMLDLLEIRSALESVAKEFDVELVVISNNRSKFEEHIRPFAVPTRYVEWSSEALLTELQQAEVVVIPNSRDSFSICKSSNRAVLSLLNGVPVVATSTPSLSELSSSLILDDFKEGLSTYLSNAEKKAADLRTAGDLIQTLYGHGVVATKWSEAIQLATRKARHAAEAPSLFVVLQNNLDWLVLRSIVEEARSRNIAVGAVLSSSAASEMAALSDALLQKGVSVFPLDPGAVSGFSFPSAAKAVLCAAESNLLPHRMAHLLLLKANKAGLYTATFQHGYETPGLTYGDRFHVVSKVHFAAQRIYLWGSIESLHPSVPQRTSQKCMTVGCPMPNLDKIVSSRRTNQRRPLTIGIFENLHWHRYPHVYRSFFVEGIHKLADQFPLAQFLLRTHPMGRWLTNEKAKPLLFHENVVFCKDAADEDLESVLASVDAVVTTPSSVALHAARAELPVALVAAGLELDIYAPLPRIDDMNDWSEFVQALSERTAKERFKDLSRAFVARSIREGSSAERIVDDIARHF